MNYEMIMNNQNKKNNIHKFNKWKENIEFYTVCGVITNINIEKYTVDVYISSSSVKIYNVSIANNIINGNKNLMVMPSVGQSCVVGLSNSHSAILLGIIPKTLDNPIKLYKDELFIGDYSSFLKMSDDNFILSKTGLLKLNKDGVYSAGKSSILEGFGGNSTLLSENKEDYFITNEKYTDNRNFILRKNQELMSELDNILYGIDSFISNVCTGDKDKIDLAINKTKEYFKCDKDEYGVSIETGDTEKNKSEGNIFSIRKSTKNSEKTYFSIKEDGTLEINCTNYIINKEVI